MFLSPQPSQRDCTSSSRKLLELFLVTVITICLQLLLPEACLGQHLTPSLLVFFCSKAPSPPAPQSLCSKQRFFAYVCSVTELKTSPAWALLGQPTQQQMQGIGISCCFTLMSLLQELFSAALLWSTTTPPALCLATYPSTSQTPSGRMSGMHSVSNLKQRTRLFGLLNALMQSQLRALNKLAVLLVRKGKQLTV